MKTYDVSVVFTIRATSEDTAEHMMRRILTDVEQETQLPDWIVSDAREVWEPADSPLTNG